ncbi:MAG: Gfo/Idh/MocA family oxidoreductase [Oscillospiraceae bacterium]|nr:Gfo/Idh/MocA family oxidoreductase [Oscillospiraceae bacterium]
MKQYNVAIIGQGRSGRDIHGAYFHSNANGGRFKVVAIAEPLAERRERASVEYDSTVKIFSDYTDFFAIKDEIDIVVNATPSYLHYPVTKDLLKHGFNVVCEKPLARKACEVDDLIATAKKSGKLFNIFQQSRFPPYFQQVKKVIASGVLGRIVEIDVAFNGFNRRWDWQTLQAFNGGNLLNTGPHPLDQALNLLDMYDGMPNVFCHMDRANTFGDAEDYCKLILTAPGKPLIEVSISSCDMYPSFTYKIHAEKGGLKGSMTDIEWKYYVDAEAPEQKLIKEPLCKPDGTPSYCGEKLEFHEEKWNTKDSGAFNNAVDCYYTMIYDNLTDGKEMEICPCQVRQQIAVIEECHRQNPLSRIFEF